MVVAAILATMPIVRPYVGRTWAFTIDMTRGLRLYPEDETGATTLDYSTITVVDEITGAPAENVTYAIEGATVRGVYIKGSNAAGSGFVGISGLPGPLAYLVDDTVDTAIKLQAAGTAYLAQYRSNVRGRLSFTDRDPTAAFHPGSTVYITDARIDLAGTGRIVGAIRKRFQPSGREDWDVDFGGVTPTLTRLARRLALSPRS